jgi:NADH-quinone oxidoreductase subunit M
MLTISLILIPLIASLVLFVLRGKEFKLISLTAALLTTALSILAWLKFDSSSLSNFAFDRAWIPSMGIHLAFAMDGISLLLVMLTTVLTPIILFSAMLRKNDYSSTFYGLILLMEAALLGVFTTRDGLMFYIFWELALIPIYFICALWGGENRVKITLKFFIYTMFGSLIMLAGLIWLYLSTPLPHSFSFDTILRLDMCSCTRVWIFFAFFLAFAIKMPVFPFHSWQPDTYTVAPTAGSMLLAGIMLKMGIYGLIRLAMPVGGPVLAHYSAYVLPLALIGLLYGSIIAIRQKEVKRLIAYSSFAHVGLMCAAVLVATQDALQGVVFQMLSHGVNVVALFFVADIIYSRTQTLQISELGGIAKVAPRFAIFFMIVMLGSVALPLTNGFIGEFLMLVGMAQYSMIITAIAGLSIILGAVYMFWLYQRAMYGETKETTAQFTDLTLGEMLIAVPLVLLILLMGIYPKPLLDIAKPAAEAVLTLVNY